MGVIGHSSGGIGVCKLVGYDWELAHGEIKNSSTFLGSLIVFYFIFIIYTCI